MLHETSEFEDALPAVAPATARSVCHASAAAFIPRSTQVGSTQEEDHPLPSQFRVANAVATCSPSHSRQWTKRWAGHYLRWWPTLFQVIRTEALKTGCQILLIRAVSGSAALSSHCTGGEPGARTWGGREWRVAG